MRSFTLICTVLLGVFHPAIAAENATEPAVAPPPACGLQCINSNVLASECYDATATSPLNVTCVCTNVALNNKITACVQASCGIVDQLQTKKYSTQTCHVPGRDRRSLVSVIALVFGALALVAYGLRCFARLTVAAQQWGISDWIITLAIIVMIPLQCLAVPLANHGLGLDMWNVPTDSITTVLHIYYWDEMFYATSLSLTKISILFFYLKIFPGRQFRYMVYALIFANICYIIVFDCLFAFQCNPIAGAWLSWNGGLASKCININIVVWSAAAINIVLDLAVLALPLPELFRLSMSLRKKIQIIMMFAVGFFVTLVSIIRLRALITFGNTQNVTQDYVETGYWSTIEVPVGIICACMPAIRSLFSLVFPKAFSSSRRGYKSSFGSRGPSVMLSSQVKKGSKLDTPSLKLENLDPTKSIKVKQEWTVVSSDVGRERYPSDEELVRPPRDSGHSAEIGPVAHAI